MAEEQALDRVHRMGQEAQVHAIRYIVEDSIEEVSCLTLNTTLTPYTNRDARSMLLLFRKQRRTYFSYPLEQMHQAELT